MIVYFAGVEAHADIVKDAGIKNVLVNYYSLGQNLKNKIKKMNHIIESFDNVFLDSGGFSARMSGVEISIDEYISFLKKYKNKVTAFANLDTKDVKETLENEQKILDAGLTPLPVIHYDDYKITLKRACENYKYIAVGGIATQFWGKPRETKFFKKVFSIINTYKDKIVHGFGIAAHEHLSRFPWYSVDTTSWLAGAKWGIFYYYNRGKIKMYSKERFIKKYGKSFSKLSAIENMNWSLIQWKRYADYLEVKHAI